MELPRSQGQKSVSEVDDVFISIQFVLTYIVGVGYDLIESFVHRIHFDHFLVIISDISLDDALEHIRGIELVHTVLVHIDQHTLLAVVPD